MKTRIFVAALFLSACGQGVGNSASSASLADGPTPVAQESLCRTFTNLEEPTAERIVTPFTDAVSSVETAMIQMAVLSTDSTTPVTPDQALAIFADKDNEGSLGGTIEYFKVMHNNREKTVIRAVYFPGDNEYGVLFRQIVYGNGQIHVGMIGTIGDSDVYCME